MPDGVGTLGTAAHPALSGFPYKPSPSGVAAGPPRSAAIQRTRSLRVRMPSLRKVRVRCASTLAVDTNSADAVLLVARAVRDQLCDASLGGRQ